MAHHAGIDIQRLAGDPARVVGGKERHHIGDMFGLPFAFDRLQHLDEAERLVVRAGLDALGLDQARASPR